MIFRKNHKYFIHKATLDKASNKSTAYRVQLYNDRLIDKYVESFSNDEDLTSKPSPGLLWAELSVLNRPDVYKNYQRIINSKYTSNEAFNNIIIKNKANKDLNRIVEAEVERISKNLDYVEQVMRKYNAPFDEYKRLVKEQKQNSVGNRQQILKEVALKSNELLISDGLNIPSHVYTYRNLETTAENLLRQSQMGAKHEEINAINDNYVNEGKDKVYNGKEWIWTGAGQTTRHASNHLQRRQLNEPFIIVNDATLEIDELMYPSDPDGSYGNTFICYCEVDYLTEAIDELGVKFTAPSTVGKPTVTPATSSKPLPSTLGLEKPTKAQLTENLNASERMKYANYERLINSHEKWLNENPNADVKLINNRRQKLENARKNLEDLRLKALGTPKTEAVTPTVKSEPVKSVVKEEPKPTVNEQIKTIKQETKPTETIEPSNTMLKGEPTISTELNEFGKEIKIYTYENDFKIVMHKNADFTFEQITSHIESLPLPLKNISTLKRIDIVDYPKKGVSGEYFDGAKKITLYNTNKEANALNTLTHELAHALDASQKIGKNYHLSEISIYEKIFKADNKLYTYTKANGRTKTPNKFPTDYAGRSYLKNKKQYNEALKHWKKGSQDPKFKPVNKFFTEDFAESTKLYLNPKTHAKFVKQFPNRAEYLEKIYGKPKFNKDSPLNKLISKQVEEGKRKLEADLKKEKQVERFDNLTEKELNKHLEDYFQGDKRKVEAYHKLKNDERKLYSVQSAISSDDINIMIKAGWDKKTAKKIMENPNDFLPNIRSKRRRVSDMLSKIDEEIMSRL